MSLFALLLVISTAFDAILLMVAHWLLVVNRSPDDQSKRVTLADVALAVAGTTAVVAMKLVLLTICGLPFFGLLHLLYLDLAVVVPIAGVAMLMVTRTRFPGLGHVQASGLVTLVACVALSAAPVAAYATFVEPLRLQVEDVTIPISGAGRTVGELRIAVLADLQFSRVTDHERNAVRSAMSLKPDIIVLPGDVFQGNAQAFERNLADIRDLLSGLSAPGGVYVVEGDCDVPERLRLAVQGTGVKFVYNDVVKTVVQGQEVAIAAIELAYDSPAALATIGRLAANEDATIRIVLAHRPDIALELGSEHQVDLVIAGHTHGGQVQLPGFGPLITFTGIPREAAAGGVSIVSGTRLYVSRGVGCERGVAPRLRLFCVPEVSLLRVTIGQDRAASG